MKLRSNQRLLMIGFLVSCFMLNSCALLLPLLLGLGLTGEEQAAIYKKMPIKIVVSKASPSDEALYGAFEASAN